MIEPQGQRIQGNGEEEKIHSKIYEVLGIDTGAGGFVFVTGVFSGRSRTDGRDKVHRREG
jgi:hypothetical protein